ncbi:MAG: ABC transporter permease, partial [Clostridia bacterium]|nr:ABC transporter permease [Clostridia bacterium]
TSFAGSIGIIGIALILALSNGIQLYIDRVEEDALSSYPLTIDAVTMDSAEILATLVGDAEGRDEHKEGYVYSSPVVLRMIQAVLGGMKKNDLVSFKKHLESDECDILNPDVATVVYQYGVTPYIWHTAKDDAGNDKIVQANPSYMLEDLMNGMPMDLPLFSQLLDNPELLSAQFDLLEGEWPDAYNEVVIVTDSNTQINDLYLYALGIKDQDELSEKWGQIWAGGDPVIEEEEYTYAELMQEQFTVIVAGDLFVYDEAAGHYVDKTTDLNFVKGLINGAGQPGSHAVNLKISGIIRPKPDATATSISGVIGYTSALTDYLIEQGQNMDVVKAQLQNPHLDVLTGLPFRTGLSSGPSDTDKVNQITQILTPAGQSHEELREMWKGWLSAQLSQVRTQKAAQTILYMHASRKNAELEMLKNNPDYTDEQKQEMAQTAADKMLIKYFALALGANADQVGDLLAGSGGMMFEKEQLQNPALVEMMIGRMYDTSAAAEKQELMQSITGMYVMVATGFGFGDDPIFAQTGLLTTLEQDVEKASADIDAISDGDLPGAYTAALKALDQATLIQLWDERYGQVSENTYEMNLETIGAANKEQPTAIYIYPVSFDQKQYVVDQIEKYNGTKKNDDDKIVYTDYVGVLFSSISMILNIITYVLVAFVAISLVVSSIMIGIITYISVLERTKEIGILRAIGASKRDVSRVFNAETMIVGFVAGLMGIVATLLLMIPINAIIRSLSGVSTIGADLPFVAALALIFISMGLTLIAGLVPSRVAAKKDPVEALRTE